MRKMPTAVARTPENSDGTRPPIFGNLLSSFNRSMTSDRSGSAIKRKSVAASRATRSLRNLGTAFVFLLFLYQGSQLDPSALVQILDSTPQLLTPIRVRSFIERDQIPFKIRSRNENCGSSSPLGNDERDACFAHTLDAFLGFLLQIGNRNNVLHWGRILHTQA